MKNTKSPISSPALQALQWVTFLQLRSSQWCLTASHLSQVKSSFSRTLPDSLYTNFISYITVSLTIPCWFFYKSIFSTLLLFLISIFPWSPLPPPKWLDFAVLAIWNAYAILQCSTHLDILGRVDSVFLKNNSPPQKKNTKNTMIVLWPEVPQRQGKYRSGWHSGRYLILNNFSQFYPISECHGPPAQKERA